MEKFSLAKRQEEKEIIQIPEIEAFKELADKFPSNQYDYNLYEAHLKPKEYDQFCDYLQSIKKESDIPTVPTARSFYTFAFKKGRTSLIPGISDINRLKESVKRIIKFSYTPPKSEERKIYAYYVTAYPKGQDRNDGNTKIEYTPLQAVIEYQKNIQK